MIKLALAAALALPCVGCASVTRGTTENISISTTPSGATAEISGLDIPTACVTPCVVQAKRNADITVSINKEGYEPQTIPLTKEIPGSGAAGFAGNILLGGVVGMGVDAVTGAALDHKPNPVIVTLQPVAPVPPRPEKPRPHKKPPPPQSWTQAKVRRGDVRMTTNNAIAATTLKGPTIGVAMNDVPFSTMRPRISSTIRSPVFP
jgi:hypothetical protein